MRSFLKLEMNVSKVTSLLLVGLVTGVAVWKWWYGRKSSIVDVLSKSHSKTIGDMVNQLLKLGVITDERVAQAMLCVDRANYVPRECLTPYREAAVPIGFNATISAPHMHAMGLDILFPKLTPGATVLDVGCGSGYISACLAHLVGPHGKVYGIDHVPELVDWAKLNIGNDSPDLLDNITLQVGDGFEGFPEYAPYDAIYVGAAAEYVPEELVKQLKPGGRMIIPVGPPDGFHSLVVVDIDLNGEVITKNLGTVRFVPLTSYEKQIDQVDSGITRMVSFESFSALVRSQYIPAPDTTPHEIKILKNQLAKREFNPRLTTDHNA